MLGPPAKFVIELLSIQIDSVLSKFRVFGFSSDMCILFYLSVTQERLSKKGLFLSTCDIIPLFPLKSK